MKLRIAVIGCGSVSQQFHLPAIASSAAFELVGLADNDPRNLKRTASVWNATQVVHDYRQLRDLDAVIVATPHSLHAPMCEYFLTQGVHVLVEKPLALTSVEARKLVELAQQNRRVLAVGVFRRFYPVSAFVKSALQCGSMSGLGRLLSVDAEEGAIYDWALQSRYLLNRSLAGGGVLIDTGSHLLDRLLWWLPEFEPHVISFVDDADGGVEADCELWGEFQRSEQSIKLRVCLSRIRQLRNTIRLQFEGGWLEIGANSAHRFVLQIDDWNGGQPIECLYAAEKSPLAYFVVQLENFAEAIEKGTDPIHSANSNLRTVEFIEACYQQRSHVEQAWERWP
ncbi:MAG: Gfo/Idh/MocA family oxidoreductase [Kiritimatiellae bacterium]|nr:Gfo/Idh/MocA family oxidoreductase [Kiritimatiellia bacterium]MDW8458675.1 Gfo/Idh/MocA family oxidoreductase [Verrucomicrobiota bacterium]